VEDVAFELCRTAKLHDHGVVLLPVYAIEYSLLGKSFRAFVSALLEARSPSIGGMAHRAADPRVSGTTADAALTWKTIGELRLHESSTNQGWKVRRYWQEEVARVMPEFQKGNRNANHTHRHRRPFGGFRSAAAAGDVAADDYALLGLARSPPPTAAAIAAAFRALAMTAHPDRQHGLTDTQHAECTARFQSLLEAHARLRRKHTAR